MGEGWELERIEFLYGYLWQFDWIEEKTREQKRMFVRYEQLAKAMREALTRGDNEVKQP